MLSSCPECCPECPILDIDTPSIRSSTFGNVHTGARANGLDGNVDKERGRITSWLPLIAEHALAHLEGFDTVRAYLRTDFFDKRRELMDAWGALMGYQYPRQRPRVPEPRVGQHRRLRRGFLMPDALSKVDRCAGPDAGANHFVYYFRSPNPLPRPVRRGSR